MILSGDYIIAGLLIYSNRNTYCNFTILCTVTGKKAIDLKASLRYNGEKLRKGIACL